MNVGALTLVGVFGALAAGLGGLEQCAGLRLPGWESRQASPEARPAPAAKD